MSDTPNPDSPASAPITSAEGFDERLKRTDEDRWLASRYASGEARARLVAVWMLNQELQRALQAREPMLAKVRIQWWRETLQGVDAGQVRRHDVALELARTAQDRTDLMLAMLELVDRYDDIADDHLSGGHQATPDHEARHYAAEGQLAKTAGLALRSGLSSAELAAVATVGEAHLARVAGMSDAAARWEAARKVASTIPADAWPAIAHVVASGKAGPLAKRWALFRAVWTRRL